MRELGEQWVDEADDGNMHMYKAIKVIKDGYSVDIVVKDLGIMKYGLLPCPFCGHYPVLHEARNVFWYLCHKCGCRIHAKDTEQQAKDAHNKRV